MGSSKTTPNMNLLYLAPDIQEEILFLDRVTKGKDPIVEKHLGKLAMECNWSKQRRQWERLHTSIYSVSNP